jgi:hypothetical protein
VNERRREKTPCPKGILFRFSDGEREWRYGDDDPPQPGDRLMINGRAWSIETAEPQADG